MENKSDTQYKGQGKWAAATQSFIAWVAGTELLTATVTGLLGGKSKFWKEFRDYFQYKGGIGKFNMVGAALIGGFAAVSAYNRAEKAEQQHNQLVNDNVGMRSQLNQTGQILQHVAAEVEKGKLADSELTMTHDAPPSHVARLEAKRAEHALHEAHHDNHAHREHHASHAEKHEHHASHAEQVQGEHEGSHAIH